jgi:DUF4097 and DUF4098 domain-containing protein YvlB
MGFLVVVKEVMKYRVILISFILIVLPGALFARGDGRKDKQRPRSERTAPVDPNVTVSICTVSGDVNVLSWDKNEVSVVSADAQAIELQPKSASMASSKTNRLEVVLRDDVSQTGSCQSSSDVTLTVPRGAMVRIQTRDGAISANGVAEVYAVTQNGDISVERATRSVEVCSVGGSVSVRDSSGRVSINSVGGAIEAADLHPAETGDAFEAVSVSGEMNLQQIGHAQVSARTTNGNVNLVGPLARGGRYGFRTMSGDINLELPADASFRLNAKVSQEGDIVTDFPLTLVTEGTPTPEPAPKVKPPKPEIKTKRAPETPAAPETEGTMVTVVRVKPVYVYIPQIVRRVNGVYGTGDAVITVASFSGTLHLKKL